ncbi:MAG: LysR family transcriptional regulator [Burkholderiaceae bacterium]|nr:LysR family transcriptional regulator [Burkholderiaceae bacterium]
MDTRFIESFVVVAECGSVAEASRRLNMTPSALAQRIRVLEQDFGVSLLTRSGRFVRLTEAGTRLLTQAKLFRREVRKLKDAAMGEDFLGSLQIGCVRSSLSNVTSQFLNNAVTIHPSLTVLVEVGVSQDLYHQVAAGKLDAAFIVAPPFRIPKSLTWKSLRQEPLFVIAAHRLTGMTAHAVLANEPLIRYDRRGWGGSLADQYLQEHRLQPVERFELDSLDGILTLVEMDLGVSLMPNWVHPRPLPQGVIALPLEVTAPSREIGMLWPAQSPYSRLVEQIMMPHESKADDIHVDL